MTTTSRRRGRPHALVEVAPPTGWALTAEPFPTDGEPDLILQGPTMLSDVVPLVAVLVERSETDLDGLCARVWSSFSHRFPSAVLTSSDVWPHPVWGDGRLVQTARIDGDVTRAHDWYLFRDGAHVVRIEVDCALADLLSLEDDIAALVARVHPKAV